MTAEEDKKKQRWKRQPTEVENLLEITQTFYYPGGTPVWDYQFTLARLTSVPTGVIPNWQGYPASVTEEVPLSRGLRHVQPELFGLGIAALLALVLMIWRFLANDTDGALVMLSGLMIALFAEGIVVLVARYG